MGAPITRLDWRRADGVTCCVNCEVPDAEGEPLFAVLEWKGIVESIEEIADLDPWKLGELTVTRATMRLTSDGRPSARKRGYTVRWEKARSSVPTQAPRVYALRQR